MRRLKEKIIFALLALALATPAAAHVPPPELAPAVDLRHQTTAQELVQPFPVFAGTTAFEDVTRIELPPPSLAAELAHRFAAGDVRSRSDLAIFERTVSRKLASGPLAAFEENNLHELNELGPELHRAIEFQALPFAEPATGLVYARARWYDPSTGSFLTPDPLGYQDSSNLYAFAGGDPVNGRDPTGEQSYKEATVASELVTVERLVKNGWKVISTSHRWNSPGEDVLAVKNGITLVLSPTGEMAEVTGGGTVLFVDDKNLGSLKAYSSTALNENFVTGKRLEKALEAVESADHLTEAERAMAIERLTTGKVSKAIMAGAAKSKVRGVGPTLLKKGIGFLPETGLGKAVLFLTLGSILLADDSAQAAVSEVTFGGSALNEDDPKKLADMLVLAAVADEMNRRRFIGPPAPSHLKRYGATGGW